MCRFVTGSAGNISYLPIIVVIIINIICHYVTTTTLSFSISRERCITHNTQSTPHIHSTQKRTRAPKTEKTMRTSVFVCECAHIWDIRATNTCVCMCARRGGHFRQQLKHFKNSSHKSQKKTHDHIRDFSRGVVHTFDRVLSTRIRSERRSQRRAIPALL